MNNESDKHTRKWKGRGAASNPDGRFETHTHEAFDDEWPGDGSEEQKPATTLLPDKAKSVISHNDSPDLPFDQSINPYRGCEHGCIYCYARPTHSYLGLSPGLDFETRLFYKPNAGETLEQELRKKSYRCSSITLGANTDAYQPTERRLKIAREILEVLSRFNHPVSIVTKSALVTRDIDILAPMAEKNLAMVLLSITTLDSKLSRRLEPRASAPRARLEALRKLSDAGIPAGVLVAPVIPALNDSEIEAILTACREAGATFAGYSTLRLPHEVKTLFREWLQEHEPLRAAHVMSIVRSLHGGKDYVSEFGHRMRGSGPFAELIATRFGAACKKLGFKRGRLELDCSQFARPPRAGDQLDLL